MPRRTFGLVHAVSPLSDNPMYKAPYDRRYPGYPQGVGLEPHITGSWIERDLQNEGVCERGPCRCTGVCRAA